MGFRKKCIRKGHKFTVIGFSAVPYVWCKRDRCDAISVAEWVPETYGRSLHNLLPVGVRVPREER